MQFEPTENLLENLERKNILHLIITAAIFAIILQMTSFLLTQTFFASSLESLVRSQWRLLSYQEWREVRNGITAGWVYFPNIDDVCIRSLGQIIETARACTLNSTDINFWGIELKLLLVTFKFP